ncbi:DUF5701 family protein [Leucobacter sp. NPDC015123]|uniref:DUF5701 family protein n=1 Tax=Leucobacter sp. NPDC015123 TaxID=3364129 RepID=UPI0036F4A2FB
MEGASIPQLLDTQLPSITSQLDRLVELGVHALAGLSVGDFRALAGDLQTAPGALLVVAPGLVPASRLAPLLRRVDKPGFVVEDMTDLDAFESIPAARVRERQLYDITGVERGDEYSNWSPDEALPEIVRRGRRPLTVNEGISWLLQQPDALEPGACFMTVGSRKRRGKGLDARTPAIWISGGTGRDGRERRGAPKVGWCWAGNRHTWLGVASSDAAER